MNGRCGIWSWVRDMSRIMSNFHPAQEEDGVCMFLFSKVSMRYHVLLVISSVSFVSVSILGCFFVMGALSIHQRVVSYSIYKKSKSFHYLSYSPQASKPKLISMSSLIHLTKNLLLDHQLIQPLNLHLIIRLRRQINPPFPATQPTPQMQLPQRIQKHRYLFNRFPEPVPREM